MKEYNADKFVAHFAESAAFRTAVANWGGLLERLPDGATVYLRWPASVWRKRSGTRKLVWLGGLLDPDLYTGRAWFRFKWMTEFHGYQLIDEPRDSLPGEQDTVQPQFIQESNRG